MRHLFIVNPVAGERNDVEKIRQEIAALPEREDCEVYVTTGPGDAARRALDYCGAHAGEQVRLIGCGGDGTIGEVFTGAARALEQGMKGISVSCYPCGSGNDFVKSFGGAAKFQNAAALVRAAERPLDLLQVGERYSCNVVNFGLDTKVAITVNEDRDKKGHGSKASYTKGLVKALINSMRNRFTVKVDGEVLNPEGEDLLCTIANGQYVGGSYRCAPRALTDDGLAEVCIIRPISRLRALRVIKTYTAGEHLDAPSMRDIVCYRQGRVIEVSAPAGFAYSLDGEIIYQDSFTVRVRPGLLSLAVPE